MVEKHSESTGNTYAIFIPTFNPEEPDYIDAKVYLDNKEKPILEHQFVKPEFGEPLDEIRFFLLFGCSAGMELSESYWDYVAYTTEGAFSPKELPTIMKAFVVEPQGKLPTKWAVIRTIQ